ncbi:MAG: PQQ-binding-like beta-propeller repeat protein [Bacteroidetes bacterium]|nr:PQQ-binding-like beta-propeller repeat protein [Bacteroidota bacterium]
MQNQKIQTSYLLCILSLLYFNYNVFAQEETKSWTDYRGPEKNGHSAARNIPTVWNDSTNVTWKTPIPGRGWSSPVVLNNKIWLTTALSDGKELRLLAMDATTGKMLHNLKLFKVDSLQENHPLNSYASPSPVIEAGFVYAHFGTYGTTCVNTESGKVVWKRTDFHCEHEVGPGSSPLLYNDLLILTYDGTDVQFLVALDKHTGETIWKRTRDVDLEDMKAESKKAFTTPIVAKINGMNQLISVGPHIVAGYQPQTGERIWYANFKGFSASSRPLVTDNILFFNTGFGASTVIALALGGEENATDSIKWINKKSTQARSSALLIDSLLYMVNTGGQAKCFIAKTGVELWTARVGTQTSASPIYAEGKIYTFDEDGLTTIFTPGTTFHMVGENQLPDGFMASPAVVDSALFLRTKSHLYRIE